MWLLSTLEEVSGRNRGRSAKVTDAVVATLRLAAMP